MCVVKKLAVEGAADSSCSPSPFANYPKNRPPAPLHKGMKSPINFKCHVLDQEVLISFDMKELRMPLKEAESLQHRLAYHVFYGDGEFEIGDFEIDMDDAFVLNEVLGVAFEEGFGVAFGEGDEER